MGRFPDWKHVREGDPRILCSQRSRWYPRWALGRMVVAAQGSTFLEASATERGITEANPASDDEPAIPSPVGWERMQKRRRRTSERRPTDSSKEAVEQTSRIDNPHAPSTTAMFPRLNKAPAQVSARPIHETAGDRLYGPPDNSTSSEVDALRQDVSRLRGEVQSLICMVESLRITVSRQAIQLQHPDSVAALQSL